MYCPKCGTENAEANKFCRACRENLKVVSQAMKQRLPVVLASKFDQMLDSRSKRFRRDSVLLFLMGLVFLVAKWSATGAWGNSGGIYILTSPIFLFSAWSYLAYRRSLAPDFDWGTSSEGTKNAEPFDKSELVTLDSGDSHTESNARTTNKKNPRSS
jgi:hypothetical protein